MLEHVVVGYRIVKPRLHDTTCCQSGCQTRLTPGCIEKPVVSCKRGITVRERDPPYITPPIKVLLRRRNKLLRQGKADSALAVTKKGGKMIADVKSKLLSKATASGTKQLWQLLRSTRNWSSHVNSVSVSDAIGSTVTDEGLNVHFANIATDPNYSRDNIEDCLCCIDGSDLSSFVLFSEYFLTIALSRIRSTSPGPEGIPFWLYRTCAPSSDL